jgi:hypothetical protein
MKKYSMKSVNRKLLYNLRAFFGGPFSLFRKTNICMWHTGRCGSTVLADLIKKDGRIDWGSEILEGVSINPPLQALNNDEIAKHLVYRIINKRQKIAATRPFGFEMKLWHYKRLNLEIPDVLNILDKIGFNKHIILERRNYLRVGVSAKVAKASGQTHLMQGQKIRPTKIEFNVSDDRLQKGIELHEKFYRDLKKILPSGFLYICYEDDIESNPYAGYTKVLEYLGYDPKPISTQFMKTNPKKLSEIIENYDEVNNYLAKTPYHWMIKS